MNIGIFTNAYHPITSGVVKAIDFMREGLTSLGHQVYIVAPNHPGYKESESFVFRYPSIKVTSKADFPLPIPYAPGPSAAIEKLKLDVVHCQHPFLLGVTGAKLAARKKIPLVFTFHTRYEAYAHYVPFFIPVKIARLLIKKMVSSYLRKCSAIVVPSPSIQDLVNEYGGGEKCHTIPNAIDLLPFQKADGKKVRKACHLEGKKVAVFVGRLAEEKNLLFLLEAFSRVVLQFPHACLMLVGDGPFRAVLEKEVNRLNLNQQVIFTGMVPYPEVPGYLGASSVFVITSKTEVKPLSILEAMACGLPVLAVRASGAIDTVTDQVDGILVEERIDDFSKALLTLFKDDEKLKKLGLSAREKAQGFDFMTMAKKLEALYESLSNLGRLD